MRLTSLPILSVAVALTAVQPLAAQSTAPVRFETHQIDEFRSGYSVSVADFNNDGRLDVIANALRNSEVVWYENPGWERHVIVEGVSSVVNQAMADINGDGIPEVAYQSEFAMQAANSEGQNWIAFSDGDPNGVRDTRLIDSWETSHHIQWADLDGDGELELLNAPLIGAGSLAPTYDQDQASFFWYDQDEWNRHLIDDEIPGIIHRIRPVKWDGGNRDAVLMASFEGIALYQASGSGSNMRFTKTLLSPGHVEEAPRLGASDVGTWVNGDGRRILGSVEPWHGNEVVVYTKQNDDWQRRVLYDGVTSGHEIAVLDLNGDFRGDIVANSNRGAEPGVHVFFSPEDPATGEWSHTMIETEYGMNGCVGGDINLDALPDLICTGSGGVIRWYENLGR